MNVGGIKVARPRCQSDVDPEAVSGVGFRPVFGQRSLAAVGDSTGELEADGTAQLDVLRLQGINWREEA